MSNLLTAILGRLQPRRLSPSYQNYIDNYNRIVNMVGYDVLRAFQSLPNSFAVLLKMLDRNTLQPTFRYRHFTKPKRDGTLRQLAEPDANLKKVQVQILKRGLKDAQIHPAAVGFRRKKSTADHAWAHAGATTIITADIEDFFPNTRDYRVHDWWKNHFIEHPNAEEGARLMTLLTTYRGSLPQGAPTSPALSNIVNYEMDLAIERHITVSGGTYTRYCDDLAFSWRGLSDVPSDFEAAIRAIMWEYGYRLHRWQVWDLRQQPQITGIVLSRNGGVELPADMQRTMRRLASSENPHDALRLQGYRAYESMVKKRR